MENKFKEFWIVPEIAEISYEPTNTYPHNVYHVIEYAAIESANAEIKRLQEALNSDQTEYNLLKVYYDDLYVRADGDRITKLEMDNKNLQTLLEKAVEMATDIERGFDFDEDGKDWQIDKDDMRQKAREFLKQIDKKEKLK